MRSSCPAGEHGRVRRSLSTAGVLLVAAAVALPAGPAAAGETLAPGGGQSLVVPLPDWASRADRLGVSVGSLVQYEHDCGEPEFEAGDETCGAKDGELADFLDATVAGGTDDGGGCRATQDPVELDLLSGGDSVFDSVGVTCLVLALEFPNGGSDDNRAQSDSLAFTLDVIGEEALVNEPGEGGEDGSPGADLRDGPTSDGTTSDGRTTPDGETTSGGAVAAAEAGTGTRVDALSTAGGTGAPAEEGVVGSVATPVTVDGNGLATESESTSLAGRALAWGSLLLGAIVLGGLLLVLVRRRRERAA
jgi:hypothetical protein